MKRMAEYIEREALKAAIYEMANSDFLFIDAVVDAVDNAPTADVVEVVPELRKAVELLRKEYEKAKQNPVVHDPLAYAVYQVWKAVDGRRNGR